MAATDNVERQPDERCPDCGGGFARDLKKIGYRRHLERLQKRDAAGAIVRDRQGNPIPCGGTPNAWDQGNRS
jgi:hypothetical protein